MDQLTLPEALQLIRQPFNRQLLQRLGKDAPLCRWMLLAVVAHRERKQQAALNLEGDG